MVKDTIWISYLDWNFSEIALYLGKLPIADPRKFSTELISETNNPGWQSQLGFINGEPQILATSSVTNHHCLQVVSGCIPNFIACLHGRAAPRLQAKSWDGIQSLGMCAVARHAFAHSGLIGSWFFGRAHAEDVELWAGWASAKGTTL